MSESDLKQYVSKKGRLCLISESILVASEVFSQLRMPLTLYNAFPESNIRLGTNDDYKAYILGFWDSCSATSTGNIPIHQCIFTQNPHMVEKCEQFDDWDVFETIKSIFVWKMMLSQKLKQLMVN